GAVSKDPSRASAGSPSASQAAGPEAIASDAASPGSDATVIAISRAPAGTATTCDATVPRPSAESTPARGASGVPSTSTRTDPRVTNSTCSPAGAAVNRTPA